MTITFITPLIISLVFGLVVATVKQLIIGPWNWRGWGADVWVFTCFCYIILFGAIRIVGYDAGFWYVG